MNDLFERNIDYTDYTGMYYDLKKEASRMGDDYLFDLLDNWTTIYPDLDLSDFENKLDLGEVDMVSRKEMETLYILLESNVVVAEFGPLLGFCEVRYE